MPRLYLLRAGPDAPGWKALQADAMQKKIELVNFDRDRWALLEADEPPSYEGMTPTDPEDGMYLDPLGQPVYVLNLQQVSSAYEVLDTLGDEAQQLLQELGDADFALERLGRSY